MKRLASLLSFAFAMCVSAQQSETCTTMEVEVSRDDVEETSTSINFEATSLTLGASEDQVIGLRFRDVRIPQGAQITEAILSLTTAARSRGRRSDFNVAFDFTNYSHVITGIEFLEARPRTQAVSWVSRRSWSRGSDQRSPNLAASLQQVISLEDWKDRNTVTAIITRGSSHRHNRFVSTSESGSGARLRVCYRAEEPVPPQFPSPHQCGPRVRRAYSTLTCEERRHYAAAVEEFVRTREFEYHRMVEAHFLHRFQIHGTSTFLPWHRAFVLQYENYLRSIPGYECITVPYWDSERETSEAQSQPLAEDTFGSLRGHTAGQFQCIQTGIARNWRTIDSQCLSRMFRNGVNFARESTIASVISQNRDFESFSIRLEGIPHANPHNYIGGQMSSHRSPLDPLFFMHHANIDRLYALWQNYHGHHTVSRNSLTSVHYRAGIRAQSSRNVPISTQQLDSPFPFSYDQQGSTLRDMDSVITTRDVWDTTNLPGGVSVTYGTDNMANQLGSPRSGEWEWFIDAPTSITQCTSSTSRRASALSSSEQPAPSGTWSPKLKNGSTMDVLFASKRSQSCYKEAQKLHPNWNKSELLLWVASNCDCKDPHAASGNPDGPFESMVIDPNAGRKLGIWNACEFFKHA